MATYVRSASVGASGRYERAISALEELLCIRCQYGGHDEVRDVVLPCERLRPN